MSKVILLLDKFFKKNFLLWKKLIFYFKILTIKINIK